MSSAVIITVSLKDSSSDPPKLKLKDSIGDSGDNNLNTDVSLGANITWVPDLASGIQSIDIVPNNGQTSIFESGPTGDGTGKFVATIKETEPIDPVTNKKVKSENYTIKFLIDGDDTEYPHDPKLTIKN